MSLLHTKLVAEPGQGVETRQITPFGGRSEFRVKTCARGLRASALGKRVCEPYLTSKLISRNRKACEKRNPTCSAVFVGSSAFIEQAEWLAATLSQTDLLDKSQAIVEAANAVGAGGAAAPAESFLHTALEWTQGRLQGALKGNIFQHLDKAPDVQKALGQDGADFVSSAQAALQDPALSSSFRFGAFVKFFLAVGVAGALFLRRDLLKMPFGRGGDDEKDRLQAEESELPLIYDPKALDEYFAMRPLLVWRRNAVVAGKFTRFGLALLADYRLGRWDENMPRRAEQLMHIIEDLGPAYIKIVQMLSTRADLVPEGYLAAFQRLQDNVRTFSTEEARQVLETELGRTADSVFEWLSEEPLAAASLGQVYRGKLRAELGGGEVAVKVQRPRVLTSCSLDIHIMRRVASALALVPGMHDQWATVLDDWAYRFFDEMNYELEARNTMTFKRQMQGLRGIAVAKVFTELTSRRVIVTEWVEGERLSQSHAADVRALCTTLLNCYLIQLLETGLLHADPHPGNLLRKADGTVVMLDFGLMTEVTESQRISFVEFITHLTLEDWPGVANDLANLGFLPNGLPPGAEVQVGRVMEQVMGQIVRGGGLKGLNMVHMGAQLQGAALDYKLCLPPYFALVLRAFSVIEGIALQADPGYAIVQECMPYLSRRLLTDKNPRMRAALRQLLYGKSKRLDVQRVMKLIGAFGMFSTSPTLPIKVAEPPDGGATVDVGYSSIPDQSGTATGLDSAPPTPLPPLPPVLNETTKEVLKVVFSKDGSYAQELIVEELVAACDAMSREAAGEALRMILSSAGAVAAIGSFEIFGPLRAVAIPLALPLDVLSSMQPAVALTAEDRQTLATIRLLLELMQPSLFRLPGFAIGGGRMLRAAGELAPLLPELLPGIRATVEMFIRQFVRRMAMRLAEDLTPGVRTVNATAFSSSRGTNGGNVGRGGAGVDLGAGVSAPGGSTYSSIGGNSSNNSNNSSIGTSVGRNHHHNSNGGGSIIVTSTVSTSKTSGGNGGGGYSSINRRPSGGQARDSVDQLGSQTGGMPGGGRGSGFRGLFEKPQKKNRQAAGERGGERPKLLLPPPKKP